MKQKETSSLVKSNSKYLHDCLYAKYFSLPIPKHTFRSRNHYQAQVTLSIVSTCSTPCPHPIRTWWLSAHYSIRDTMARLRALLMRGQIWRQQWRIASAFADSCVSCVAGSSIGDLTLFSFVFMHLWKTLHCRYIFTLTEVL